MAAYRIVTDNYSGYEVQEWRWWWPFWVQCGRVNTHPTVERAEMYANRISGKVVKRLGWLS